MIFSLFQVLQLVLRYLKFVNDLVCFPWIVFLLRFLETNVFGSLCRAQILNFGVNTTVSQFKSEAGLEFELKWD